MRNDIPAVKSIWRHRNGNEYRVIGITNLPGDEKYPTTVVYQNVKNGTLWSRRADDWHRSFTLVPSLAWATDAIATQGSLSIASNRGKDDPMVTRVDIIEEVPGVEEYRWLVSGVGLPKADRRCKLFKNAAGTYSSPKFDTLDEAKVWCADHGFHWRVERFEP